MNKIIRSVNRMFLTQLYVFVVMAVIASGSAVEVLAEEQITWQDVNEAGMAWVEYDGELHEVKYAAFENGEWTEPVEITHDEFTNLHPALVVSNSGDKWILWTAISNGKSIIRWSREVDGVWMEPADIPSEMQSNIKPAIVLPSSGIVLAVWSANNGGLDDIYFSLFENNKWNQAEPLHGENAVPDILPLVTEEEGGQIIVKWSHFDSISGRYVTVQSLLDGKKWSEPVIVPEVIETSDTEELEQPDVPDFVPVKELSSLKVMSRRTKP